MASKPVDAAAYYTQHADKEREYYQVYIARPVKAGENATNGIISGKAEHDGYEITSYRGVRDMEKIFMTEAEFAGKTKPADIYAQAAAPEDMPAGMKATPVKKGKSITVTSPLPIATKADYDGFILETADSKSYFSNYELTSIFNYAGKKESTHPDLLVRMRDEAPIKGVVLDGDVTFKFKGGDYKAEAGALLVRNPDDEDGYTVYGSLGFAQVGLRLNALANPGTTLETEVKVKGPLKFKR